MKELSAPSAKRIVLTILGAQLASLIIAWGIVPLLNDLVATLLVGQLSPHYWSIRLRADLVHSFLSDFVVTLVAIRIARINPFLVALPISTIAFVVWFTELGGVSCMGACGQPLWYDLWSIPNQFLGPFAAAFIAVRSNNSFKPSPLRGLGPTGTASGGPA